MVGVRQWEEELGQQCASRLLALRAHTETVLRGEVLAGELLEPEVLHFATRFRPLFMNLFIAYADWPSPEKPKPKPKEHSTIMRTESMTSLLKGSRGQPKSSGGIPSHSVSLDVDQQAPGLGHMSFVAFFRFCVDFGLFPKHANFEEIRNIYSDAEAVIRLKPEQKEAAISEDVAKPSEVATAQPPSPASQAAVKPKGKKLVNMITKATAAAIATTETCLPQAKLKFFSKPMASMNESELKLVTFFAAVDEWLNERFVRLADVITKSDSSEEEMRQTGELVYNAAVEAAKIAIFLDPKTDEFVEDPAADKPAGGFRNKQDEEAAIKAAMKLVTSAATAAVESVPSTTSVSAKGFLEVIAPMRANCKPGEEELESMFKMLLDSDPAATDGVATAGDSVALATEGSGGSEDAATTKHDGTTAPSKVLAIPVFQLDKVLRKASEVIDRARRWSCSLMRTEAECSASDKVMFAFFEEINKKMFDSAKWKDGNIEDIFEEVIELTPDLILKKATDLGVPEEMHPNLEDIGHLLDEAVGKREGMRFRRIAYRFLAFNQEGRSRRLKQAELRQLQCLTKTKRSLQGPNKRVFGLAAFMESVLKIALHRLGFKGLSDIQRGSPAWWKCTWLLTLLDGRFSQKLVELRHERNIVTLATEGEGTWEESFSDTMGVGLMPTISSTNEGFRRMPFSRGPPSASSRASSESEAPASAPRGPGSTVSFGTRSHGLRSRGGRAGSEDGSSSVGGQSNTRRGPRQSVWSGSVDETGSSIATLAVGTSSRHKNRRSGHDCNLPDKGPNQDAEVWWRKVQTGRLFNKLPRNVPPLEWIAMETPDLFKQARAEAQIPLQDRSGGSRSSNPGSPTSLLSGRSFGRITSASNHASDQPQVVKCTVCGENSSLSGWGNPSCVSCSGVEDYCLPIEKHLFYGLLKTHVPEEREIPKAAGSPPGSRGSVGAGVVEPHLSSSQSLPPSSLPPSPTAANVVSPTASGPNGTGSRGSSR
eukprot:TRINITY_DN73731_c0_g1_i1.p1 TRINITY_DN73731_c0_g1~~TRINITY_DN73731_c0_g1_i1.p1  ORF type:complete len:992 (+),score=201.12 TRINITY_DN73731_c0_g1_i1:3-2978(+)